MNLTLVTPPNNFPVDITAVKEHLRIDHSAADTYLEHLIEAATNAVDGRFGYLRRALLTQTWLLSLPEFWFGRLRLPMPPLQSVLSVKYYDLNNALQTLDPSVYAVSAGEFIGQVELAEGQSWPGTYTRFDAVQITFRAGFGDSGEEVPAPIRHAILMHIGELYANRGDGERSEFDPAVRRLLSPYRVMELA